MNNSNSQWIRDTVVEILAEESATIHDDENLFEAGLDSVGLLRLVNRLRRTGTQVNFADLAQTPTLTAWSRLICEKAPEQIANQSPEHNEIPNQQAYPIKTSEKSAPLGVMQHAYWAGRSPGQRLGGVAAHLYVEFDRQATGGTPAIEPDKVRAALARLVERHQTLRTRIGADGRQSVLPAPHSMLKIHDLTNKAATEVEAHLANIRDAFSHQMLDIENGEIFAVALSLLPDGATRLHVDVDMIAADAVSYRILLSDFVALYHSATAELPSLRLTYCDYLTESESSKTEHAQAAAKAWQQRLATLPGAPILPENTAKQDASQVPRVARRHVWLPPERKSTLGEVARHHGVTPAMIIATILAEIVGHWSATDHFLLNVPMFNRPDHHPDIEHVVGDFSSSVMLEVDLRQPLTFLDRVRALQQRMHHDAAHAAYTGLDLLRELGRQRGETVLAPIVFTSALGLGELFAPDVTNLVGKPVWIISQGPQVLLDAQVTEFESGLLVNWDTREDALQLGIMDAMFSLFNHVLDSIIDEPATWTQPLSFSALNVQERRLDDQVVRIIDRFGRDCPDHVVGLLQTGGEVPPEIRGYARAENDGRITLLGDETERVTVHGVPVWALEVEEAIRTEQAVEDVAVVRHGDQFVAAVVLNQQIDGDMNGKSLRMHLSRRIASHLLPAQIIIVDALPHSSTGHIDQDTILKLQADKSQSTNLVAPRNDLERVVASVWQEILGLENIGINEEFIALGGDSLLAARVVSRLQEELDTNAVTLRSLFRSPTVAELAEQLRKDDDPARLDEIASIILEIRAMSDEDVANQLAKTPLPAATDHGGTQL